MRCGWGLLLALCVWPVCAQTPWQRITQPVVGPAQAIGSYANGCIIGAQALPLASPDYQVMRSQQRRYFGHPTLLAFIERLSEQAKVQHLGTVLIGDMAMPAGGRFNGGHASHQSGLDVDIWLQLPQQRWSQQQLRQPVPQDLVAVGGERVIPSRWSPKIGELIKLAAEDAQVSRIFVNPAIKRQLCDTAGDDRQWLHKVRPWFAHRAHMHVRLNCPPGSTTCEAQVPPPPGDGCGAELASWFLPPSAPSAPAKPRTPPPLPPACQALLAQLHD
ncbi:penicillin-insensitive murein endopeptidase [Edwardsiella tarda]|uniref:penicillin-insensitive murein endopeptidase n=1 Tax=Edwardsiella TaxID=635 RepID=UPI00351C9038